MEPLAARIRPQTLDEFIGQEHLVGEGKPIREAIEKKHLFSFILWGPPGVGKTTLARIYAHALNAEIFELSAVSAGKEDIKKILKTPSLQRKVLFLDEIHRFNKAQQDFLLPYVESGAAPESELQALDQLFARLIAERISHGDFKGHNLFWQEDRWALIDLDSMCQHSSVGSFAAAYARDRARFMRNWPESSALYQVIDQRLPKDISSAA